MRKLLTSVIIALLFAAQARSGTVTGQVQNAQSGPLANGTFTFTLTQGATVAGTANVVATSVNCFTDASGNVVGEPNPLVPPVLSSNLAAGTLAGGTYFVKLTYSDATGQTVASPEASITLASAGTLIVTAPVTQPAGVTSYSVYISTTSGAETLQGAVTVTPGSWGNFSQSSALTAGSALPVSNGTACKIRFNDELTPSFTCYNVGLTTVNGSTANGYPQFWNLAGGASGTVNVSLGTPQANICQQQGWFFPQAILATPTGNGQQSISGPLSLGSNSLTAGQVNANTALNATQVPSTSAFELSTDTLGVHTFAGIDTVKNPLASSGACVSSGQFACYPEGNNLNITSYGPANMVEQICPVEATGGTNLTANVSATVTVSSPTLCGNAQGGNPTAVFSFPTGGAGITICDSNNDCDAFTSAAGNADFVSSANYSIVDGTHMTIKAGHNHTQPYFIRQSSTLDLHVPIVTMQPDPRSAAYPAVYFYDSTTSVVWGWPVNVGASFPNNAIRINGQNPITGFLFGGGSDIIQFRGSDSTAGVETTQSSTGNVNWFIDDSARQKWAETSAPSCAANFDFIWADSTAHRFKVCDNNGSSTTPALFTDNLSVFASGGTIAPAVIQPNGVSVVQAGVPALVAEDNKTAQSANIGSTTLLASGSVSTGTYRVSCYVVLTTPAGVSSTLPFCQVQWTDADTTTGLAANIGASQSANTTGTKNIDGAPNTPNVVMFNALTGHAITYITTGYASNAANVMQYAVHIKLEFLGN